LILGQPIPNHSKIEPRDRSLSWTFELIEVFLILDLSANVKLSLHRIVGCDDDLFLLPVVLSIEDASLFIHFGG
jgi:hypothetical protein